MSVKVENLEKNMAKLTITVDAEQLEKAIDSAYKRQKNKISLPGFRKGKVPRNMVEKMYGAEVFYEDAANILIQQEYPKAYEECGLEIVSQPTIDVVEIEKGKDFVFTAEVATKPEVTLGKYMGVTVERVDVNVTDEEVEAEINTELEKNSRTITVERPAQNGDVVKIDFEGSIDGEVFEGGSSEDFDLELGSHSFIDTFEDQLVGHVAGDDVDVNVTFPEDYQASDLAGKAALFKVSIKEVKATELPELDDDFVGDVSDCETVDEYKKQIAADLKERKEAEVKRAQEDEAIDKIIDAAKMDIPEPMVDAQVETLINEFAQNITSQGMPFDQYLQFTGMTMDKLKEQVRPDALKRIQGSLCLEQIAKEENIEVSAEDIEEQLQKMADAYGMELDQIKELIPETEQENMKKDIAVQKAVDLVMENVKPRAKAKKKTEDKKEDKKED